MVKGVAMIHKAIRWILRLDIPELMLLLLITVCGYITAFISMSMGE